MAEWWQSNPYGISGFLGNWVGTQIHSVIGGSAPQSSGPVNPDWLAAQAYIANHPNPQPGNNITPADAARISALGPIMRPGDVLITGKFAGQDVVIDYKTTTGSPLDNIMKGNTAAPPILQPAVGSSGQILRVPDWWFTGVNAPQNTEQLATAVQPYNKDLSEQIKQSGQNPITGAFQNLGLLGLAVLGVGVYLALREK